MNTPCPHCQTQIGIDPETHATLQGNAHFQCPSCDGLVLVPPVTRAPVKVTAAAVVRPNSSLAPGRPTNSSLASAHRGQNRNLLILGTAALLVLGGLGIFLASQKSGDSHATTRNIRNEIINNSYFQNLIINGVTTEMDLKAIAEIRPYLDGFIGISKEALTWGQAQGLAQQTGSDVLSLVEPENGESQKMLKWLAGSFGTHLSSAVWVRDTNKILGFDGIETQEATVLDQQRRVFLHWRKFTESPALATKEKPFMNSLGMQFVPIPGTKVLFCIHHTREGDYRKYAESVGGVNERWKEAERDGVSVSDGEGNPVVNVSWQDANDFCAWLSKKEGRSYRLPKDHEWSVAVGIGAREDENASPASKNGKISNVYPWGTEWPPPTGSGNYSDSAFKKRFPKVPALEDYRDGFATTSPVMSFASNRIGLYDMSGNVYQFCEDWYDHEHKYRVLRGGCWEDGAHTRVRLLSSVRNGLGPKVRATFAGFRCVLATAGTD